LYWWHGTVPHFSHDIKSACININKKYIDFISTVTTYSFCALWTSWLIFSLSHATFSTTWLTDWWCTGTTNNVVRMCIYYIKVCSEYHRNCLIHLQMERLRKKLQWCKQHSVIWVAQLLMCQTIWTTAFWTIKCEKSAWKTPVQWQITEQAQKYSTCQMRAYAKPDYQST